MADYYSAEEENCYYSSDQESLEGIDNEESDLQPLSSRKSTTQVPSYSLLRLFLYLVALSICWMFWLLFVFLFSPILCVFVDISWKFWTFLKSEFRWFHCNFVSNIRFRHSLFILIFILLLRIIGNCNSLENWSVLLCLKLGFWCFSRKFWELEFTNSVEILIFLLTF